MWRVLEISRMLGCLLIIKKVVDVISLDIICDDHYSDVITDYREMQLYFQIISLTFIRRKDNQLAGVLTRGCRHQDEPLYVLGIFSFPLIIAKTLWLIIVIGFLS